MKRLMFAAVLALAGASSMLAFQSLCSSGVCVGSGDTRPVYFIQDGVRRADITGGLFRVPAGSSTSGANATVCGTLDTSITETATIADQVLTTLYSYTVPPNTIETAGRGIEIIAHGKFGATGNTKNMFIQFGNDNVIARSSTSNGGGWEMVGYIQRVTATTHLSRGHAILDTSSFEQLPVTQSEDFTGPIAVTVKSQNGTAAAGDAVFQSAVVRCF